MADGEGQLDFDGLMNRVKSERCENSYKLIFENYYGKILSYFKQNGVDPQKSTELAQETMIIVWQKAQLFDGSKGSFQVWLFTIARNLRFDFFRANHQDALTVSSDEVYDQVEDPSLELETLMFNRGIREKLKTLPIEQKNVVEAIYMNGFSHAEYAEQNNIPLGTVKSRIRLALVQLKKGMEE